MNTLIIASHNTHKAQEIMAYLSVLPDWVLEAISAYTTDSPEETGLSFLENALIKARHAALVTGHTAIADDSGLCVEYLQGAPGVHSRRFSGDKATDEENWHSVLAQLEGVTQRRAFFYCSLVYLEHPADPCPIIAQGYWHGSIAYEAQMPDQGFGYEPIFIPENYHCTANQLKLEEKNAISHRGQAMQQLLDTVKRLCLVKTNA